MRIAIKRAYEAAETSDGYRALIDRLWPRGVSKEDLALNEWCRDIAPSTDLRKWFNHEELKINEFHRRYQEELEANTDVAHELLERAKASKEPILTLVYSAKASELSQAPTLKEYLEKLTPGITAHG